MSYRRGSCLCSVIEKKRERQNRIETAMASSDVRFTNMQDVNLYKTFLFFLEER